MSLAAFTYKSAKKYKRGGPGDKLDHGFTIHAAILVSGSGSQLRTWNILISLFQ